MAANAFIPLAGWQVRVGVPLDESQASLDHSIWLLAAAALSATLLTMLLGAASYKEADAVAVALQTAAFELESLRARERLVVNESSHRVKNILAVVQSLVQRTLSTEGSGNE